MDLSTADFDPISYLALELQLLILQQLTEGEKMLCWMVSRSWRQRMKDFWPDSKFDPDIILDHSAMIGSEKLATFAMEMGANNLEISFLRAALCNQLKLLKLLKCWGDVSVILWKNITYQVAFDCAVAGGHTKIMIWLKNGDRNESQERNNRKKDNRIWSYKQSLICAAQLGHYKMLKLIIKWELSDLKDLKDCDLDIRKMTMLVNYCLAIGQAKQNGHTECVQLLIDNFPTKKDIPKLKEFASIQDKESSN